MKKIFPLLLIFLLLTVQAACLCVTKNLQQTRIDSVIKGHALNLMNNKTMIGWSLGIYLDGKQYFYNYGSVEKGRQVALTQNTIYEVGSITKTFTGILLAQAIFENKIKLDEDIRLYLKNDYKNLEFNGTPIKIVHLANHSSGLPEGILPEEFFALKNPTPFDVVNFFEGDSGDIFLRCLKTTKPETNPGSKIQYSNTGMNTLGLILENVYHMSYAELIKKYFTDPLKMENTEIVFYKSDTSNYTKGYDKNGNIMPHITFQIAGAAGGLKSTTADMIKYIRENVYENDAAVKLSHQSTIDLDGQEFGLGWQIRRNFIDDNKLLWHNGGEPGFSSYIAVVPTKNIGMICLTNQRGRQVQLADLVEKIMKALAK